jgi:hypothetical protein
MMPFRNSLWLASTLLLSGVVLLLTKDNLYHPSLLRRLAVSDSTLGIIHLSKCHGKGMQMLLREHKVSSELGRRPAKIYHMNRPITDAHYEFLALVRDPIDRVRAAWAYEHPRNAPFRKYPNGIAEAYLEKKNGLYQCYETFDDLATNGLGALEGSVSLFGPRLLV